MVKKILSCWYLVLIGALVFFARLPNWLFIVFYLLVASATYSGFTMDVGNPMTTAPICREPWYLFQRRAALVLFIPMTIIMFIVSWIGALGFLVITVLFRNLTSSWIDAIIVFPTFFIFSLK